jgi:hypothetical protein
MKKLAALALVVWGLFYASQNDMLPGWVPIPKMSTQTTLDIPPPSLGPPEAAAPPRMQLRPQSSPARAPIGNTKFLDQQQKRLEQQNAETNRRVEHELKFGGNCAGARGNLSALSIVDRSPDTFVLKEGGRVLTDAERAAARAENEKFVRENCRP